MTDTAKPKEPIPITESNTGHRKIPKAVFIEDVAAWVERYGEDDLFGQMQELYQKYKFMESQMLRQRANLKVKLPDITKTIEAVAMLKKRSLGDVKELETHFLVSDNIWAKATIPNESGKVGLWLGANVMVEYNYDDALKLLLKN